MNISFFQNDPVKVSEETRKWFFRYVSTLKLSPHNHTNYPICHNQSGLLGNEMFQFAAVYSVSKFYGRQIVIDSEMAEELQTLFTMKLDNKSTTYTIGACSGMPNFTRLTGGFHPDIVTMKYEGDFEIDGYFESWKYFYHDIKEILKLFTLTANFTKNATSIIREHCPPGVTCIGVHVRRGWDIRRQQKEAPWSYFQQAMQF